MPGERVSCGSESDSGMSARVPCCVPFCRRTRDPAKLGADTEWLCPNHWRLVERSRRRLYARATRGQHPARSWLWARLKVQAIERAAGIA